MPGETADYSPVVLCFEEAVLGDLSQQLLLEPWPASALGRACFSGVLQCTTLGRRELVRTSALTHQHGDALSLPVAQR